MIESQAVDLRARQADQPSPAPLRWSKWEPALLVLLLVLATSLRLWWLESVPPGLTHDEAGHAHDAAAILDGARPLYQTVGYGREPLYDYLGAAALALTGQPTLALRLLSVAAGLLTLVLTYAWGRRALGGQTALLAATLQGASFWSLSTSRQALRSSLLPPLLMVAIYGYWRFLQTRAVGPERRGAGWAVLSGLGIGASLVTYLPARLLWATFPLFLVYLAVCRRALLRRVWGGTLAAVALGLLLAAPMLAYLWAHPEAEQRLDMLSEPLQALRAGDLTVILSRAADHLAGLVVPGRGDGFLAYNIRGRPVLDWGTGVLAVVGIGLCLVHWRNPAHGFLLIWLLVGNLPSLVTGATASSTRSIGALPALFVLPAMAATAALRWSVNRWGRRAGWVGGALCAGWVLALGAGAARDYFPTWGESPHVRAAYQHTVVEAAAYIDAQPAAGVVVLSSVYPHAPHDPYVLEASLQRDDLAMRWCDGRRALLVPAEATARLLVPASAPLDRAFADLPGLEHRERVQLRTDDLDPFFDVYEWDCEASRAALRAWVDDPAQGIELPVDLGGRLRLLGYDLPTVRVTPGGALELVTLWQATDAPHSPEQGALGANLELVIFAHVLDGAGGIVGQEDRLDAPNWGWHTDDLVVQIHRITVAPDAPLGPAELEVGVYHRADMVRLPVLVDGAVVDDRVMLQALEVGAE